jgi:peptidoglycan hydrolase CwlO-like protein
MEENLGRIEDLREECSQAWDEKLPRTRENADEACAATMNLCEALEADADAVEAECVAAQNEIDAVRDEIAAYQASIDETRAGIAARREFINELRAGADDVMLAVLGAFGTKH